MTVEVSTPDDVTLANYRRVAYGGEQVQIRRHARQQIGAGRSDVSRAEGSGGTGLDEAVVRGIVFARLTNLVSAYAPSRPELAERVAALLDGPLPALGVDTQTGANDGVVLAQVLEGLESADLADVEQTALLCGSPCSAALVADAAVRSRFRLAQAEAIFALSIEGFRAPLGAYDPALDDLYGDTHETAALRSLRDYLEGVEDEGRRFHQAPVSYRIIPRVLGQVRRAVAAVEKAASVSLRAVTLDEVHLPPDRDNPGARVLSSAGGLNAMAYPALNALSAAWADLALLGERQVTALNTAETSDLPVNLAVPDAPRSGTYAYGWAASSFVEEARAAATPALLPGPAASTRDDVTAPVFSAHRRERRAAECLDGALTILALVSSQALFVTDRTPPRKLRPVLSFVREIFPPIVDIGDRDLSVEAARLQEAFVAGELPGHLAATEPPDDVETTER